MKILKKGQKILPTEQPGYYPGFSTLDQQKFWDAKTREIVLKRVYEVPAIRFFTSDETETLQAVLDRVLPQDDRIESRRIPILNFIDERLYLKRFDGYIFEGMPEEDEAHRLGLAAIQIMAAEEQGIPFQRLVSLEQEVLLKSIQAGQPRGAHSIWKKMSPSHYWGLLLQDAVSAYYSHPWAWDEIGFGGPAYPRGYMRTTNGLPEPWEKDERRYDWHPPTDSLSEEFQPRQDTVSGHHSHGQGGTH